MKSEEKMKQEDLCRGKLKEPIWVKPKRGNEDVDYTGWLNFFNIRPSRVKRIRLRCPECGRRVWSSISQNDGDIYHELPPHKPKGWWKKPKKESKHDKHGRVPKFDGRNR